ncbi:nuclear transport factor 2 family protein [Actinomyces lilanjuaniae]|uniref:Nuclear transport factor 2 family protein n=1 Tax=Actinomyces lilanjuaniae TaxID=2321394 RepID=A0ABN5PR23_9ACTO|nr:nuclear transport factor 2 family protein [Actinomyces lilanjuaniae]
MTEDAARGNAPGAPRDATLAALAVVRGYHQAWTTGDVEGAMRYVADDIFCRAPEADFRGKEDYRDYIASFAPELTGIGWIAEMVEVLDEEPAEGVRIALFYYPQTAVTSTTPAAELFTVRDGRIAESVLAFDRIAYVPAGPGPASGPEPASPGTGAPAGDVGDPEGRWSAVEAPGAGGSGKPDEDEAPGRAEGKVRTGGSAGGPEGVRSS